MNIFSNKKFGLLPNLPTKINHIKFSSKCRLSVAFMIFSEILFSLYYLYNIKP